jgi:hypothetical protein
MMALVCDLIAAKLALQLQARSCGQRRRATSRAQKRAVLARPRRTQKRKGNA